MRKRFLLAFSLLLLVPSVIVAQTVNSEIEKGYIIVNDTTVMQGYVVVASEKNNLQYVDFLRFKNATPERFTINDINEYGYDNVVYEATSYKDKIVFMKRMNSKEPYLYYYKSDGITELFFKNDNKFVLIPSEDKELKGFLLQEMGECEYSVKNIKFAKYNKERLAYIFERNSNCDDRKIPYFNYGVFVKSGMSNLKMDPNRVISYYKGAVLQSFQAKYVNFTPQIAYGGGVFIDVPLNILEGKLSFHPEIEYRRAHYNYEDGVLLKFDANYFSTNLLGRYRSLKRGISSFIDFGIIYSILDINNAYVDDYVTELVLSNSLFGLGFGAGLNIPSIERQSIDVSVRYAYLFSGNSMPNVSNLDLVVGYNF
jgi:hypothetical protein